MVKAINQPSCLPVEPCRSKTTMPICTHVLSMTLLEMPLDASWYTIYTFTFTLIYFSVLALVVSCAAFGTKTAPSSGDSWVVIPAVVVGDIEGGDCEGGLWDGDGGVEVEVEAEVGVAAAGTSAPSTETGAGADVDGAEVAAAGISPPSTETGAGAGIGSRPGASSTSWPSSSSSNSAP